MMKYKKPRGLIYCGLDGDMVAYRAAYSTREKPEWEVAKSIEAVVEWVVNETVGFRTKNNFAVYLTGKNNFRHTLVDNYKANRVDKEKPKYLNLAREILVDKYGAIVVNGAEADDALATDITKRGHPEHTCIASNDKDMKTVNCWHFNIRRGDWFYSDEVYSKQFFYKQILMGDNVDGIIGINGVGPKKAEKIVGDATEETEMYSRVLEKYTEVFQAQGNSIEESVKLAEAKILETGRLLHLRRYDGELWEPDM